MVLFFADYIEGGQKTAEHHEYHGQKSRRHIDPVVQVGIKKVADGSGGGLRIQNLLQIGIAQASFGSVDGIDGNEGRGRASVDLKVGRGLNAVYQPLGRRAVIVVDDSDTEVFDFECSCPRHDEHHHAGEEHDQAWQKAVAFQLPEFFFDEVAQDHGRDVVIILNGS